MTKQGSCDPIECSATLAYFDHASNLPATIAAGGDLLVTCADGYQASGETKVLCENSGNMTKQGSCDPIECSATLAYFDHASNLPATIAAGGELLVTCADGYQASGETKVLCDNSGN